jgi:diaminopimelate decarboxylase
MSMSSNYNTRPRASEVLVAGEEFHVVRSRETFEQLIATEKIAP